MDRIELDLIVKRPGRDGSDTIRMPTSAALLSGDGSGISHDDPDFVTARDAGIDTDALETALLDAYFQPSLDAGADSLDTQMREYRRRMAYSITELLDSAEAAADGTIRSLVESCILPVIDGGSTSTSRSGTGASRPSAGSGAASHRHATAGSNPAAAPKASSGP